MTIERRIRSETETRRFLDDGWIETETKVIVRSMNIDEKSEIVIEMKKQGWLSPDEARSILNDLDNAEHENRNVCRKYLMYKKCVDDVWSMMHDRELDRDDIVRICSIIRTTVESNEGGDENGQ